jgi:hypothetical protein
MSMLLELARIAEEKDLEDLRLDVKFTYSLRIGDVDDYREQRVMMDSIL